MLRCLCAQDDLEPVLRAHAASLPAGELRFGTELIDFQQNAEHVTATLREAGGDRRVRARSLIAADGARSRVRETLGIAMRGNAGIYRSINVLLRADLTPWVADRPAALYFIEQPGLKATFLTTNGVNRLATLDLFGDGVVLLAGVDGAAWRDAAHLDARGFAAPIAELPVPRRPGQALARCLRLGAAGAVLVRPARRSAARGR